MKYINGSVPPSTVPNQPEYLFPFRTCTSIRSPVALKELPDLSDIPRRCNRMFIIQEWSEFSVTLLERALYYSLWLLVSSASRSSPVLFYSLYYI